MRTSIMLVVMLWCVALGLCCGDSDLEEEFRRFAYDQVPLQEILDDFGRVSGKRVLTTNIPDELLKVPCTIESVRKLTSRTQWLQSMERALLRFGLVLLPRSEETVEFIGFEPPSWMMHLNRVYLEGEDYAHDSGMVCVLVEFGSRFQEASAQLREMSKARDTDKDAFCLVHRIPEAEAAVVVGRPDLIKRVIMLKEAQ